MSRPYIRILTIAGSDSGGGAGIQADLKTFQALGCYGMSAITVLTAQNTSAVRSIFPASPSFVSEQIESVVEDIGVDAVKIGMVLSAPIISAVTQSLRKYKTPIVVLDPVMVAKGGSPLLEPEAIEALKNELIPVASLITPNLPEAEILLGKQISSKSEMESAAQRLLAFSERVVLKGGHLTDQMSPDLFAERGTDPMWISFPRIETRNTHGTGCTFSAAITAYAARGFSWGESVSQARKYLQGALEAGSGKTLGQGHGPVDHAWNLGGVV